MRRVPRRGTVLRRGAKSADHLPPRFYTSFLAEHYRLTAAARLFELPLDSITVKELKKRSANRLPRWKGVKHLTPALSRELQQAAAEVANEDGIARVHLDAIWWSVSRDDEVT